MKSTSVTAHELSREGFFFVVTVKKIREDAIIVAVALKLGDGEKSLDLNRLMVCVQLNLS